MDWGELRVFPVQGGSSNPQCQRGLWAGWSDVRAILHPLWIAGFYVPNLCAQDHPCRREFSTCFTHLP